MKSVYLYLASLAISVSCFAQQKSSVKWGEDFRLKKGSTNLKVIATDKSGIYLEEAHVVMKAYYLIGASFRGSGTLVKMKTNLSEVYRRNYNKELRGKEFEQFFSCGDDLFIFASDYNKSGRSLDLFAAKIDKASGKLSVRWQPIASLQQEKKNDRCQFKLTYNADSTKMVIVSSVQGKAKSQYRVQELDNKLKASKPVVISNEFEAKKYQLEDVLYTHDRKVILVGRIYEYEEGKKKKEKFLDFNHYNIRVYDALGKQESEINTTINGKWLSSSKLLQEKNQDLVLAAFYSNEKKNGKVDGLMVQRIDMKSGKIISTHDKAIHNNMLSDNENMEEDEDENTGKTKDKKAVKTAKSDKKDEQAGEGFSRYMQFRNIFYTADSGLIILAESFKSYTYTTTQHSGGTNGTWKTVTYSVYESGDLMMCKIATGGEIAWLQVVPKFQAERYRTSSASSGNGVSFGSGVSFFSFLNMPFYSGFGVIKSGNDINIVMNDNPKNATVTQADQKPKMASTFGRSDCFIINVNGETGKISRKYLFNNKEIPTAMPRSGAVIGNELYMIGRSDRLFGKTRIALGKVSVK